jgi:hypothetical protein
MPRFSVTIVPLQPDGTGTLMKSWHKDRGMGTHTRVELGPEAAAFLAGPASAPKPLDQVDGHEPIDRDELRLRFPRGPVAGWRYEFSDEELGISQVYGTFELYPDGLLVCRHNDGRPWFHSRHPGASSDEVADWLRAHGYDLG